MRRGPLSSDCAVVVASRRSCLWVRIAVDLLGRLGRKWPEVMPRGEEPLRRRVQDVNRPKSATRFVL